MTKSERLPRLRRRRRRRRRFFSGLGDFLTELTRAMSKRSLETIAASWRRTSAGDQVRFLSRNRFRRVQRRLSEGGEKVSPFFFRLLTPSLSLSYSSQAAPRETATPSSPPRPTPRAPCATGSTAPSAAGTSSSSPRRAPTPGATRRARAGRCRAGWATPCCGCGGCRSPRRRRTSSTF